LISDERNSSRSMPGRPEQRCQRNPQCGPATCHSGQTIERLTSGSDLRSSLWCGARLRKLSLSLSSRGSRDVNDRPTNSR
jgi:hypothetical protein